MATITARRGYGTMSAAVIAAVAMACPAVPALAAAPPDAVGAAATATVTGVAPKAPSRLAPVYRPAVVAYRLDQPGTVRGLKTRAGQPWRLALPPGIWAVRSPAWAAGRLSPTTRVLPLAAGRTVTVKAATSDAIPPVRLAATEWTSAGTFPAEVRPGLVDLTAVDLATAVATACSPAGRPRKAAVVEAREGRVWQAILQELRLGMSRYASPEFRAQASRAISLLPKWAPTHTVTGSMTQTGKTFTAKARVVNSRTGRTEWTGTYTSKPGDPAFFALTERIAADVAKRFCAPPAGPTFPQALSGTFAGGLGGGQGRTDRLTWTGTVTYTHQQKDAVTGQPWTDGALHYAPTAATLSWSIVPPAGCTSEPASGTLPTADLDGELRITTARGGQSSGYRYELGLGPLSTGRPVIRTTCPDPDGEVVTASQLTFGDSGQVLTNALSLAAGAVTSFVAADPSNLRGDISYPAEAAASRWSWTLTGSGTVPVP